MATRRLNSAWIRRVNAMRIFHALREAPNSSQRQLGLVTGLDKATVSAVIRQLMQRGLVERAETAPAGRAGRPETALRIPRSAGALLGVRLEPAGIDVLATDLAGRIIGRGHAPGARSIDDAVRQLKETVDRVGRQLDGVPVKSIGIGVPAIMDLSGRLVLAPNLGWRDVAIGDLLDAAFDAPVRIDNDTKAATVAERLFGTCRTVDDFIYMTAHSGVGGALFLDGEIYRGAAGFAGEIGHINVVAHGRRCACGALGCLEAYASEIAILSRLAERGIVLDDLQGVADRAQRGDPTVADVLDETGHYLALALSGLVNALNPTRVVLGGNLTTVAAFLIPSVRRSLEDLVLKPLRTGLEIIVSPLGPDAVAMGGIALALETFLDAQP